MRKRSGIIALMMIMMSASLSGCGHEHIWKAADCVNPQTCIECGKTEGEPVEHTWVDATCVTPKTCSVCGATEGDVAGHAWEAATCTAPKTCSVCGATEGEALEHQWVDATFTAPKTCSVCGETEGGMYILEEVPELKNLLAGKYNNAYCAIVQDGIVLVTDSNFRHLKFSFRDIFDNETASVTYDTLGYGITSYFFGGNRAEGVLFGCYVDWSGYESDDIYMIIAALDSNGNKLDEKKIPVNRFYGVLDTLDIFNCKDLILVKDSASGKITAEFDLTQNKFIDGASNKYDLSKLDKFDRFNYRSCCDYYQVSVMENGTKKWGFADADGNVLKLYDDAGHFVKDGYALVIENGQVNLIDTEFNVVLENITTADSVYAEGDYLSIDKGGDTTYYRIGMSEPVEKAPEVAENANAAGSGSANGTAAVTDGGNSSEWYGVIDLSDVEVTPNDTMTVEQVSQMWGTYPSGKKVMSSKPFQKYYVEVRGYEEPSGSITEAKMVAWCEFDPGTEHALGDLSNASNIYIYDESFDISSVPFWRIGLVRDDSLVLIAVKK